MKHKLNNGAIPNEGDLCLVLTIEGMLLVCEYIVQGTIENNFFSTETGLKQNVDKWSKI
jgi:hypothetical protein